MQIYAFHSRAFRQNPAEKFRFRRANFTDFYGIFHKKTARSTPPGKNKPHRSPPTAFGRNNAIAYKAHVDKTRRPARHLVEIHKRNDALAARLFPICAYPRVEVAKPPRKMPLQRSVGDRPQCNATG